MDEDLKLQEGSARHTALSLADLETDVGVDSLGTDAGFRCELVTDFSRLERMSPAWERLFTIAPPPGGIFQSWGWARAYWRAHQDELALCTPVVFAGDEVVGILPVALRGQKAELLGASYADYNGLLCRKEYARDICTMAFTALLRASLPWVECEFTGIPENSPLLHSDSFPRILRIRRQIVFQYLCPTISNAAGDVFLTLSRKQSLRRHEKLLGRRGRVTFRHVEDRQEIFDRHLHEFFRMHIARRAMQGIESQFLHRSGRAMAEALIGELDPAHELRFSVLELEGRAVAYHLGMQHAGTFTCYMPVFDLDYREYSPGEVLLRNLLKYAHEQCLSEFDLTIGDEPYKSRFSNCARRTFNLYFCRSPLGVATGIRRLRRTVRDRLRRSPGLRSRVRVIRDSVLRLSARMRSHDSTALFAELQKRIRRPRQFVLFSPTGRSPAHTNARVESIGLKEVVLLSPVDKVTNEANCDRIKKGSKPYLVSTNSSRLLYWVTPHPSHVEGLSAFVISEARILAGKKSDSADEFVSALICNLNCRGDFFVSINGNVNIEIIAQRCGCTILGRPLQQ